MTRKQIEVELRKLGYSGRELKRLTKIELEAQYLVVLMKQKRMVPIRPEAIAVCNAIDTCGGIKVNDRRRKKISWNY